MYIKVRNIGEKSDDLLVSISKRAKIQELREIVQEKLNVEIERQRLFYKGKELVDDHYLVDYDMQLNDVVQLMVRAEIVDNDAIIAKDAIEKDGEGEIEEETDSESVTYKVGDYVDMRDIHGAWFEAKITRITKKGNNSDEKDLSFYVVRRSELERASVDVKIDAIRFQSYRELKQFSPNQTVLINYNIDEPKELGYWYDFTISEVKRNSVLSGKVLFGDDRTPVEADIKLTRPAYRIETPESRLPNSELERIPFRKVPFNCLKCKDVGTRNCRECGCRVCAGKQNWEKIILCDECDSGYHIYCLDPPLSQVPDDDDWYCPECKRDDGTIVRAGEKLKFNKRKANRPSAKAEESARDWGKGMACIGRTKQCTLVPVQHVGPVPGVEVGACWRFRFQVSEAGVHRPFVAGIHGRESSYAFSIVLAGGYEDDVDDGDEFVYTGSGGRDLSGNKRISEQSCDQTLTRMNKALAMNCNAKFNPKDGAEAEDWRGGKGVRVVRSSKASKHSNYAPRAGFRYDGIYKVVKYYPEKGKSGFIVWRYLLRRDDPTPAPWHENGKEHEIIYPPSYLEVQASKIQAKLSNKRGSKRALTDKTNDIQNAFKKMKTVEYKLDEDVEKLIDSDEINKKLWSECKGVVKDGKAKFLSKVEEVFMCICCQELIYVPVTITCKHNVCRSCIKRSFAAEIYTCPCCRFELGKGYKFQVNENLSKVLLKIFPGYEKSRY